MAKSKDKGHCSVSFQRWPSWTKRRSPGCGARRAIQGGGWHGHGHRFWRLLGVEQKRRAQQADEQGRGHVVLRKRKATPAPSIKYTISRLSLSYRQSAKESSTLQNLGSGAGRAHAPPAPDCDGGIPPPVNATYCRFGITEESLVFACFDGRMTGHNDRPSNGLSVSVPYEWTAPPSLFKELRYIQ